MENVGDILKNGFKIGKNSEARERAARVAAEKAIDDRAAAEVRERAERTTAEMAAIARGRSHQPHDMSDSKSIFFNDPKSFFFNDPKSFFGILTPDPSIHSTQRCSSMNNATNVLNNENNQTLSGTATMIANVHVEYWAQIFGATPNSQDSQGSHRGGDTERNNSIARIKREQHSRDRAARAIAAINQRNLQTQLEQAERQRIGDALDAEIRRWATGIEGNLRALLSTLQSVLWFESGWVPVSMTELIHPNSVKKAYRRATLFLHPDKVQQKGATIEQKYIAEKAFELLKEAFNKFKYEEFLWDGP